MLENINKQKINTPEAETPTGKDLINPETPKIPAAEQLKGKKIENHGIETAVIGLPGMGTDKLVAYTANGDQLGVELLDSASLYNESLHIIDKDEKTKKEKLAGLSFDEQALKAREILDQTKTQVEEEEIIADLLKEHENEILKVVKESVDDPEIPLDAQHLLVTKDVMEKLRQKFEELGYIIDDQKKFGIIAEKGLNKKFALIIAREKSAGAMGQEGAAKNFDPDQYFDDLRTEGEAQFLGTGKLERSDHFRYEKDYEILSNFVKKQLESGQTIRFLNIGVGNMEETLSYLAVIKIEADKLGKKLEDSVDLEFVELRPQDQIKINDSLGINIMNQPRPPKKGFEAAFKAPPGGNGEYRFQEDIVDYLKNRKEDPNKAHFHTPMEAFTEKNKTGKYDILACNNVLQHIGGEKYYLSPLKNGGLDEQSYQEFFRQTEKTLALLEDSGLLFIHTPMVKGQRAGVPSIDSKNDYGSEYLYQKIPFFSENFEKVSDGVYRKKSNKI